MRSIILEIPPQGTRIELHLTGSAGSRQAVLVLPDGVELGPGPRTAIQPPPAPAKEWRSHNGFPPRDLTEQTIVQVLREHGGEVRIRDTASGWNIYDEIAARLGVSVEARQRLTDKTAEPAWRPEVGFARKNLEQLHVIAPTEASGRGVWRLAKQV